MLRVENYDVMNKAHHQGENFNVNLMNHNHNHNSDEPNVNFSESFYKKFICRHYKY
jgi:hypothetical protein